MAWANLITSCTAGMALRAVFGCTPCVPTMNSDTTPASSSRWASVTSCRAIGPKRLLCGEAYTPSISNDLLLAMIPNVFPLVVLLGVMVLAGVPLKPSTILVFSIAFGIAVDDSIHMMGRFTHLLACGFGRRRAVRGALRDTGPALVMSTLVVTAGFSLLLISRFELLFLVGLLTATTAVTALVADLFLFPALLELRRGRKEMLPSPSSVDSGGTAGC